ncbi:MAG: flippase [Candidatus Methanospirare jalkutatii]|nr:flippase [Candidatus Methanospirare jalkutatii]
MREGNASGRERKGSRGGKEESKQSEICRGHESAARAEIIAEALRKTAKGTALAFFGLLLFGILDFASKVLIARHASQAEYGIFSLALSLLQICTILSCLGLQAATPRCIAFFRGRGEFEKARSIVFASLQLALIASVLCGATLFLASPLLTTLFHLPVSATQIFQIFAVALPFSVAVEMLASVFRGYDRVQEKVIFRDVLSNVLKVLFIVSAIALGYAFLGMICAYLLAIITASLLFFAYTFRKMWELKKRRRRRERAEEEERRGSGEGRSVKGIRKKLFEFSAPLLVANVSSVLALRTDTFMLGIFKTPEIVGLYNAAIPFMQLIQIFHLSMVLIYVPIASQLYSKNLVNEMKRCYIIITKGIFSITFPFFLFIFLFSEKIIGFFFGSSYSFAGTALRILSLGMFIHVFFGPNAETLVVLGKTKWSMANSLTGVVLNASLNAILIPIFGFVGSAIASAISITLINILILLQIFSLQKIHPFAKNYLKTITIASIMLIIANVVVSIYNITSWMLILFLFLLIIYYTCLIVTKSFEEEDRAIFHEFKRKVSWK